MDIFENVFDAREWVIMSDGEWVRNKYTNEFILLSRFSQLAQEGIKMSQGNDDDIENHPEDTLSLFLRSRELANA